MDVATRRFETKTSRRTVVRTGVKLAYGVPLVAASFKLTGEGALASDNVCSCVADSYSPKVHNGRCYSCKTPGSGCNTTRGSAQVVDLIPASIGGETCRCNSNTCVVNGRAYAKGAIIADGVCHPEDVTCGGSQPSF